MKQNKHAIADRGWNPLNRFLLTLPEIRATMTQEEKIAEEASNNIILPPNDFSLKDDYDDTDTTITFNSDSTPSRSQQSTQVSLNFSKGTSSFCIGAILNQEQLMEAREKMNKEQMEGKTLVENLKSAKRVTAGICYKSGTNRLGKDVFQVCKESIQKKREETIAKMKKNEEAYLKLKQEADDLLASSTKPIDKWKNSELIILLKPLKRKGDRIPNRKKEMLEFYELWKNRPPLAWNYDDMNDDNPNNDDHDDENSEVNNLSEVHV